MADAPLLAAYTQLGQNSRAERVAASRVVLAHARSRKDLHELLDALGLNQGSRTTPLPAPKKASVPTPTTTDVPINTRGEA